MNDQIRQLKKNDTLELFYYAYLSIISIVCLCVGAFYWLRLVGIFPGNFWRFDLMSQQWQLLCCSLAVLYPVSAIGLWMHSRWGVILWLVASITESISLTLYHQIFIFKPIVAFIHFILFVIFFGFQVAIYMKKRRKSEVVTEY